MNSLFESSDQNSWEKIVYDHSSEITASGFLSEKKLLVLTDVSKKCLLVDLKNEKQIVATKSMNKRAMKIISTKDESSIIVGDKNGDVYILNIESNGLINEEFKLIMGHLSMLTDMAISFDEKLLFTSDRDEKIRISHFPNAYNIKGYLLGHKEFVIQIQQIDSKRLISASGDSRIILWDLDGARQLQEIHIPDLIQEEAVKKTLKGVNKFDYDPERKVLLVHMFRSEFVLEFSLKDEENYLNYVGKIDLNTQIDTFVRLKDQFYVFLSLGGENESPFFVRSHHNGKLEELGRENNHGLQSHLTNSLAETVKLNNPKKLQDEYQNSYMAYFKAAVNNLDDYYEKKKERIEATSAKRKRIDTKTDSSINSKK